MSVKKATARRQRPARRAGERRRSTPTAPPKVRLGAMAANGIGASLYGLLERGVARHARLARSIHGVVELRFDEDFAPVRISFDAGEIVVEDVLDRRASGKPDLVVSGSLPHVVQLAAGPMIAGLPNPASAKGRRTLARFVNGHVRIEGRPLLARRLLKLLEI